MNPLSLTLLGALCFVLTGCEDAIDLRGEVPAQLIVESELQAGLAPRVTLRLFDAYGAEMTDQDDLIRRSIVELRRPEYPTVTLDTTGNPDPSKPQTAFIAKGRENRVEPGVPYSLFVRTPGYNDVTSTTVVPLGAEVISHLDSITLPDAMAQGDSLHHSIPFELRDAGATDNYYHVLVRVREGSAQGGEQSTPRAPVDARFKLAASLVGEVDGRTHGVLFSDADFQGRTAVVNALLPLDAGDFAEPVAVVEVRTVNADYYRYYSQLYKIGGEYLPSTMIAGGYDNIEGASGLFGGYSDTSFTVWLP